MNRNSANTLVLGQETAKQPGYRRVAGFALTAVTIVAFSGVFAQAQDRQDNDDQKVPAPLRDVLKDFASGAPVAATTTLPITVGYFGGQPALYITPEVGVDPAANGGAFVGLAKFLAKANNSNYIPQNFATLTTPPNNTAIADAFFVFPAGTPNVFTGKFIQPNVLNSSPHPTGPANTDVAYSPIWQISLVYFQPGKERLLKSAKDIADAQAAGDLLPGYPKAIPVIVECSVIYTPEGGLLPKATIQEARPDRDDRANREGRGEGDDSAR